MVLDLRPFDIVDGVVFNELFKLVTNLFPNPNSFGNPDKFENIRPDLEEISCSRTPLLYTYVYRIIERNIPKNWDIFNLRAKVRTLQIFAGIVDEAEGEQTTVKMEKYEWRRRNEVETSSLPARDFFRRSVEPGIP